jgi:hypothetical protein
MTEMTIAEMAKAERVFLHDIANHIVVAHGMANFVLRSLKDNNAVAEKDLDRLERAIEAINKMTALLKDRRNLLLTFSE